MHHRRRHTNTERRVCESRCCDLRRRLCLRSSAPVVAFDWWTEGLTLQLLLRNWVVPPCACTCVSFMKTRSVALSLTRLPYNSSSGVLRNRRVLGLRERGTRLTHKTFTLPRFSLLLPSFLISRSRLACCRRRFPPLSLLATRLSSPSDSWTAALCPLNDQHRRLRSFFLSLLL